MTTNALTVYQSPEDVRRDLAALRAQLEDVLPTRIDADRFLRVVTKAVIENPKLMQCTRLSLLSAVHESAQLGLEPSGLLGGAYLVPYRNRHKVTVTLANGATRDEWQTVMEAKLIPGYRGLIDLARRSGEIDAIQADIVRKRDAFDYEPSRQPNPIVHRPFIPDPTAAPEERDRGAIVGVYMVATLRGGFRQPEWMTYDEVEAVRKRSKAADDGPWVTDYPEMARKTVVRRGSKYLPLTTEFRRALELDEEAERTAEVAAAAVPAVSKATAMLLDRAGARGTGQGDSLTAAGYPNTPTTENEALGSSTAVTDEGVAVDTATGEVVTNVGPDQQGEAASIARDHARAVAGLAPDATPPDATAVCGNDGGMMGTCSRAPGHAGGHDSGKGKWPRDKADRR